MKKFTLYLAAILSLSACAIAPKGEAIRTAADQGLFEGLDKNSSFSISIPTPHSGPYGSVEQFNFKIEEGKYKDKDASAIIAKSADTEKWDVLLIMVNEGGKWIKLTKTN